MPLKTDIIANLPHRRMEAWKWSDVGRATKADISGLGSCADVQFNFPSEVNVSRETMPPKHTPMGKLAARLDDKVQVLDVPDGLQISSPVILRANTFGHARIVFRLGRDSCLSVQEIYESENSGFSNIEISYELAKGAKLTRTVFQHDDQNTTRIVTAHISMWGEAELAQYALSFGAGLSRLETRLAVMGKDVKCRVNGAYLLGGKSHADMTSYIDLSAPAPFVRQKIKGVVADTASGVFQGKFHVRRPAQFTDAEMRHDALMLSETAHVRAKPELEIYADDVACAHGNTLGQLDESVLFYMQNRGLAKAKARALLMQAFVSEAFANMENNEGFMSRIEAWLGRNI